jgi:hypothetical protein
MGREKVTKELHLEGNSLRVGGIRNEKVDARVFCWHPYIQTFEGPFQMFSDNKLASVHGENRAHGPASLFNERFVSFESSIIYRR